MTTDLSSMRIKYKSKDETFLEEHLVTKEPFGQFTEWFEDAVSKDVIEPNAMCVSTATRSGVPSARFVLCKEFSKDGFKFFTSYESQKAKEIDENQNVAATFYWPTLNRSIRIEGWAEKTSEAESEEYFHSRPVSSQISAAVSHPQSSAVQSRSVLTDRKEQIEKQYSDKGLSIPKPDNWGGYIIKPKLMEFWQGQSDRLSDRIRFRLPKENEIVDGEVLHQGEEGWVYERLTP